MQIVSQEKRLEDKKNQQTLWNIFLMFYRKYWGGGEGGEGGGRGVRG